VKFHHPSDAQAAAAEILDLEGLMSDARWQLLTDALPDGLMLIDRTGLVRYLNPAAESATEVLRSEVLGRPLREFVERSRLDLSFLPQAFETGAKVSRNGTGPSSGQLYNIATRSVRDWHGNITCFIVVARNVSDVSQKFDSDTGISLGDQGADEQSAVNRSIESAILCRKTSTLVDRGLRTIQLGSRLLLLGESGVGKTEFARLLHRRSSGASRPFIHVNCGSIPETLFESEMFGYERGSFTGALAKGKRGLVEAADGGTLFLDEVGEIPLTSQAKMLQFLEEGGVQRVGATQIRRLRVQIISATNRDLTKMIADGSFRADLFYRLNVVTLRLPPLRECVEMLEELTDSFIANVNRRRATPLKLDPTCRASIRAHAFPGNIRELQNLIEHLAVVAEGVVKEHHIQEALQNVGNPMSVPQPAIATAPPLVSETKPVSEEKPSYGEPLRHAVKRYEERLIRDAIAQTGSKRKAAELLGVDIATVVRKSRDLHS